MPIHPTIFGHFSNEINEEEEIRVFAGVGSKNYAYETINKVSKETASQVTKIRGLTISGGLKEKLNIDLILQFVHKLQQKEKMSVEVPQFRLLINGVSKTLNAQEVKRIYTNFSNHKRFLEPEVSATQLWPYGVTSYANSCTNY